MAERIDDRPLRPSDDPTNADSPFTSWAPPSEAPPWNEPTANDALLEPEAPEPARTDLGAHDQSWPAELATVVPAVVTVDPEPAAIVEPVVEPVRPAPSAWQRWRMRRPRVRKVSRVVRRVDAWSVFKVALVFWAVAYAVVLVASVLLWNLADTTGTIANVEGFVKELFALDSFELQGDVIFRAAVWLGAVLALAGTAASVVAAILFNLITDLVGGIRVTVLEEEVVLAYDLPSGAPADGSDPALAGPAVSG
ncbi:MAG: DUF3566 domain-containing protein [Acidimicrobiales bacterium]